ncbi:MAG: N-acetylmuramoyl-L-alanine amidase, partial [Oscillospiraceae bacterium]
MTLTDKLIKKNEYNRPGIASKPVRICVHYTGDVGTGADRLALFYANVAAGMFPDKPDSWTSTQYIVGLNGEVIRIVPDNEVAYAAANRNNGTIHIEVCYTQKSGEFEQASKTTLRELMQYLMQKYGISADKVVRHYDLTGKYCPIYYVDETRWAALHEYITAPEVKPAKLYRVQVGAFSSRQNAENYMKLVKAAGFNAFLVTVNAGTLYRVQVGAFSIKSNAETYMEKIKAEG